MKRPTHIIYREGEHIHVLIFDGARSEDELISVISNGIISAGTRAASKDQPLDYDPVGYASKMRCAILNYFGFRSIDEMAKHIAKGMCK